MKKKKIVTDLNQFIVKNAPPSLEIDDEEGIPKQYLIPKPDEIDKKGLLAYLKTLPEDKPVTYAHLVKDKKALLIK